MAAAVGIGMFVLMAMLNASLEDKKAGAAKKKEAESSAPDTAAVLPAGQAAVSVQYCGA